MKTYKLLKDLPFAKAGDEFGLYRGDDRSMILAQKEWDKHMYEIDISDIENFDEWFEEVGEPEWAYYINAFGGVVDSVRVANLPGVRANLKSTGNYFKTREEAEKYLEYLKAKEVIKQDTKGFKPDWDNEDENRYRGCWDLKKDTTIWMYESGAFKEPLIFFKSVKDVKESFEKHPNEWRTYLTYEQ